MLTEQDLIDTREKIQDDLICYLDGIDEELDTEIVSDICEVICIYFQKLIKLHKTTQN